MYKITLVNFPYSSVEDKMYDSMEKAVIAARATGFECTVWFITTCDVIWKKRVSPI